MPIRIYALAKELEMDSKELVDVCTRAGIPGKGSALASLNDDEVTKVTGISPRPDAACRRDHGSSRAGRSGKFRNQGRAQRVARA